MILDNMDEEAKYKSTQKLNSKTMYYSRTINTIRK
jgi:hypothetical protein